MIPPGFLVTRFDVNKLIGVSKDRSRWKNLRAFRSSGEIYLPGDLQTSPWSPLKKKLKSVCSHVTLKAERAEDTILSEAQMNKILVVEDEQHQRELYAMELQDEGYEVEQAANGKEAVEKVKNNKYDLVVLDIRMPEMDGIEALGKILSRDKKIPIIIYTAYSNYKSNFMTWTADAYITKSSNLDELKNKIQEILASRTK
jgi:CheY-like chemotaxis protein